MWLNSTCNVANHPLSHGDDKNYQRPLPYCTIGNKAKKPIETITVKASNFGPDGTFGPFFLSLFASLVASFDESCTKYEQNRICRSEVFLQLFLSLIFCRTRFNDSKPFWKRGPKFPWGFKLEALTVLSRSICAAKNYPVFGQSILRLQMWGTLMINLYSVKYYTDFGQLIQRLHV